MEQIQLMLHGKCIRREWDLRLAVSYQHLQCVCGVVTAMLDDNSKVFLLFVRRSHNIQLSTKYLKAA